MFKNIKAAFKKPTTIVQTKTNGSFDNQRKSEILTDGFIYKHPYTVNGSTFFPDNILKLAQTIVNAKSPEEKKTTDLLTLQVFERESYQIMENIRQRIEVEPKENI